MGRSFCILFVNVEKVGSLLVLIKEFVVKNIEREPLLFI